MNPISKIGNKDNLTGSFFPTSSPSGIKPNLRPAAFALAKTTKRTSENSDTFDEKGQANHYDAQPNKNASKVDDGLSEYEEAEQNEEERDGDDSLELLSDSQTDISDNKRGCDATRRRRRGVGGGRSKVWVWGHVVHGHIHAPIAIAGCLLCFHHLRMRGIISEESEGK